jgi:hypothetical protein
MIIINRKHEPQTGVSPATFNYFWLTCFTFLLCILLSALHSGAVLADDPLTFLDTQPPAVLEGEDYAWKISQLSARCLLVWFLTPQSLPLPENFKRASR